jgi:hypothetical protein
MSLSATVVTSSFASSRPRADGLVAAQGTLASALDRIVASPARHAMARHAMLAKTTTNMDAAATHSVALTRAVARSSYMDFIAASWTIGRRDLRV